MLCAQRPWLALARCRSRLTFLLLGGFLPSASLLATELFDLGLWPCRLLLCSRFGFNFYSVKRERTACKKLYKLQPEKE